MHSSSHVDVYLSIPSTPIIEHCSNIRFTSYPARFITNTDEVRIQYTPALTVVADLRTYLGIEQSPLRARLLPHPRYTLAELDGAPRRRTHRREGLACIVHRRRSVRIGFGGCPHALAPSNLVTVPLLGQNSAMEAQFSQSSRYFPQLHAQGWCVSHNLLQVATGQPSTETKRNFVLRTTCSDYSWH